MLEIEDDKRKADEDECLNVKIGTKSHKRRVSKVKMTTQIFIGRARMVRKASDGDDDRRRTRQGENNKSQ